MYEARDTCCISLERIREPSLTDFCAREICHFRILAEVSPHSRRKHDYV